MADRYDFCAETSSTPLPGANPTHHCIHIKAHISSPGLTGAIEALSVDTTVPLPFPNRPQGSLLAALMRVRTLLDAEITAIQSAASP